MFPNDAITITGRVDAVATLLDCNNLDSGAATILEASLYTDNWFNTFSSPSDRAQAQIRRTDTGEAFINIDINGRYVAATIDPVYSQEAHWQGKLLCTNDLEFYTDTTSGTPPVTIYSITFVPYDLTYASSTMETMIFTTTMFGALVSFFFVFAFVVWFLRNR